MIKVIKFNDYRVPITRGSYQRFLMIKLLKEGQPIRSPINLALVLDKSKSMAGIPIEQVKEAAQRVIDLLSPDDLITIVVFDSSAKCIVERERVTPTSIRSIKNKIQQITANGMTAIDRGMKLALDKIKVNANQYVNRCILLTDGCNTVDPDSDKNCIELANIAANLGIPFSAFGFGTEYNDKLIECIADIGKGKTDYIDQPEKIVSYFQQEVQEVSTTFAKNVKLRLKLLIPDMRLSQVNSAFIVYPQIIEIESKQINDEYEFNLGDLLFNEPKIILLQLFVPNAMFGKQRAGIIYAYYDSPASGKFGERTQEREVIIEGVSPYTPSIDPEVEEWIGRVKIYIQQRMAEKLIESGKYSDAVTLLQSAQKTAIQLGQQEVATQLQSNITKLQRGERLTKEEQIKTKIITKTTILKQK